jgi:hypothetical protein
MSPIPSKIDFTAISIILPNGVARPQTNWRRLKVSYIRCKSQILKRIHPKMSSPWNIADVSPKLPREFIEEGAHHG